MSELKTLSKEELAKILSNHEKWVLSSGKEGSRGILNNINLQGEDFSGKYLDGIIFNNVNLRNANFKDAKLGYAEINEVDTDSAQFIACDLQGADLSGADITLLYIRQTDLSNVNFQNCGGILCNIEDSVLNNANLENVELSSWNFKNVSMIKANLSNTKIDGTKLEKCDLRGSDFTGAKFEENEIIDCDLNSSKIDDLSLLKIGLDSWAMQKDTQVTQLVNILNENGKGQEAEQIMLLVEQLQKIGKSYHTVFQELQETKLQVNQMQEQLNNKTQMPDKQGVVADRLVSFENRMQNQFQYLQNSRQKLNERAGMILLKFETGGVKALNKVCEFLNIKESLIKLRDIAQSNVSKMENSIEMLDKMSNETSKLIMHMKNIGNIFSGKEMQANSAPEQSKIFTSIKNHYQHSLEKYKGHAEKLNNAIQKFDELEHAADRGSNLERSSVKEKLANNKAVIESRESSEPNPVKEKQQPEIAL